MLTRVANITGCTQANGARLVLIDGQPLACVVDRYLDPCAVYQWGYPCPGSLTLARSILYAALGDLDAAGALSAEYAAHLIDKLAVDNWTLPTSEVLAWVEFDAARAVWLGRN